MKFDSVDIIPGLEDSFNNAVQFVTNFFGTSMREHSVPLSRSRVYALTARSILVSLGHSYTALNQDRQQAWSDYAKGSGISPRATYIQYNAPRVAQGLEPSRMPPLYPGNKVLNYDMFGNPPAYWTLGPAGLFLGNGHVSLIADNYLSDTLICKQVLTLLPNTDYEVAFEFHAYYDNPAQIKFGLGSQLHTFEIEFYLETGNRRSHTFHTPSGSGLLSIPVVFYARGDHNVCYINDVSVVAV